MIPVDAAGRRSARRAPDRAVDPQRPGARGWRVIALAVSILLLCLSWSVARGDESSRSIVTLDGAELRTASGVRAVRLPHVLQPGDFDPAGSTVRYRTTITIDDPEVERSIHVRKMSRAGRVHLNGQDLGSCGPLPLPQLRCLHQPQFFRPPPSSWRAGENVLEIEIHATKTQANGLSTIVVGPTAALFLTVHRPLHLLQVDLIGALSWITLGLGVLSLIFFTVFRTKPIYLWFGLTCVTNVLANFNVLVTTSSLPPAWVDWFHCSTRLVYTCFLGSTLLAFFGRDRPVFVTTLALYALAAPVAVRAFDFDPVRISWLYLPLQLSALVIAVAALFWAFRSRRRLDWAVALTFLVVPTVGVLDLMRLRGDSAFVGVYLLVYTSAVSLVLVGLSMIGTLAVSLRTGRDLASILRARVAEREVELRRAYDRLLGLELERARGDERDRMVRDMHDGFLSTLSITRVALSSREVGLDQAVRHLGDCIDDIRLFLDATGSASGSLEAMLADFMHRVEGRIVQGGIEPSLSSYLDGLPGLSPSTLLQVMRIVQEAVNNAVRHSRARTLRVEACWRRADATLEVSITDDGRGRPPQIAPGGRGLANMQRRADALGGRLFVTSPGVGTRVRLVLPVRADASTPPPGVGSGAR